MKPNRRQPSDSRLHCNDLFAKLSQELGTGVIVVAHDQRALKVFDIHYEMEDGVMQLKQSAVLTT
jgi:putative ABC transport system ATP-binding protein